MRIKIETLDAPFSFLIARLILIISINLGVYAFLINFLKPSLWSEFSFQTYKWIIVLLVTHFILSFVEYLIHRYVMHSMALFVSFYLGHGNHHLQVASKPILNKRPSLIDKSSKLVASIKHWIISMYSPEYETASSNAITYTAVLFLLFPLMILSKFLLPSWPIMLGVPIAIAITLLLSECIHLTMHTPLEKILIPSFALPIIGNRMKNLYRFHVTHHILPEKEVGFDFGYTNYNMGIGGFLTYVELWDKIFGTFATIKRVPKNGEDVTLADFTIPTHKPYWLIRQLDKYLLKNN